MHLAHPELAHRDRDLALVEQGVLGNLQRDTRRFPVNADAVLAQQVSHYAIVIIGPHVGERPAEIPQEAVADLGALDDTAGQDRQIRRRVVPATLAKLVDHLLRPVLAPRLPTIHHHVLQALAEQRPQRFGQRIEVTVIVGFHVFGAKLVGLVARSRGRRRAVLGARQRVAHA